MESNKRPNISFVWTITDNVLRDTFKKSEIGDVILPFVVLRRLDCILAPVNEKVREAYAKFSDKLKPEQLEPIMRKAAGGLNFYNISRHTLSTLTDEAKSVELNFKNYVNGFNKEVTDILRNFQFDKVLSRLINNRLLYQLLLELKNVDLSIEKVDNHDMGYVFEEIIRIANEQSNETAGEHFTPRDVIRLMSAILFTPDKNILNQKGIIRTIYDPACGTGGMVNVGKRFILENLCSVDSQPTIMTYGQELNEQFYAIAKSEALVTGDNSDYIRLGNTLTNDQFKGKYFSYIMGNPPYGVTWKKDQDFIENESLSPNGRFSAGTPRTSDGQLLFVQHMLSKMEVEGSRVAVVTNGSPLFSGAAGSGESAIRRWIIENDWLECIIGLPKDLFYNTGIYTYIWFLTNRKSRERQGKVQLISAIDFCTPAKKSLGNKRNDITSDYIQKVLKLYMDFEENEWSKIYNNSHFGFLELTVEQPQRNENGDLVLRKGNLVPDVSKRSTETIGLHEDYKTYFAEEVLPYIDKDSWIDLSKTKIGYEINFARHFYKYEELRSAEDIAEDIKQREQHISHLFNSLFK